MESANASSRDPAYRGALGGGSEGEARPRNGRPTSRGTTRQGVGSRRRYSIEPLRQEGRGTSSAATSRAANARCFSAAADGRELVVESPRKSRNPGRGPMCVEAGKKGGNARWRPASFGVVTARQVGTGGTMWANTKHGGVKA